MACTTSNNCSQTNNRIIFFTFAILDAIKGISNAPGTQATSMSFSPTFSLFKLSNAPANSLEVINSLNLATTIPILYFLLLNFLQKCSFIFPPYSKCVPFGLSLSLDKNYHKDLLLFQSVLCLKFSFHNLLTDKLYQDYL